MCYKILLIQKAAHHKIGDTLKPLFEYSLNTQHIKKGQQSQQHGKFHELSSTLQEEQTNTERRYVVHMTR